MADGKRPSARRRLPFTDPDRSKIKCALDSQEKELNENETNRFKERWGYDPVAGKPVQGSKFEYSRVDPATIPSYYLKGYQARKPRPVGRSPTLSDVLYVGLVRSSGPPPHFSAKRKLDLSDDDELVENDENKDVTVTLVTGSTFQSQQPTTEPLWDANACLPSRFKSTSGITSSSSVASSPSLSSTDGQNRLCDDSDDSHGLCRSSSSPSLHELSSTSPTTKEKDIVTPPTRSKSVFLTQSSMKDYLPNKKPRISSKALPRQ